MILRENATCLLRGMYVYPPWGYWGRVNFFSTESTFLVKESTKSGCIVNLFQG